MISPYSWQQPYVDKGVGILRDRGVLIDASDTGTGKTVCALARAEALGLSPLIVCPKAVSTAWRRTAAEMSVKLVDVINPERLIRPNMFFDGRKWGLPTGSMVTWDEVHRGASGSKAKTTAVLANLKGIPLQMLSATIADTPLKLRGVGYVLGLHDYRMASYYEWCKRHGCRKAMFHQGLEMPRGKAAEPFIAQLHAEMAPFMVRMRIADVPGFPECAILAELFDLDKRDTAEVNAIYEAMSETLKRKEENELTVTLRARQRVELYKVPILFELMRDAVDEGKYPITFICFRDTMDALVAKLEKEGIPTGSIYGGDRDRQDVIDAFQAGDIRALVSMSQAGGLGISLHDTTGLRPRVSFISPGYNASDVKQCLGRIWRATGVGKVVQTFVLLSNTVEEKVYKALQAKLRRISILNDGGLDDNDLAW